MKIKPRRMKKYKPRRRKSNKSLVTAQILDIERILEMDLGTYIILCEEGSQKQVEEAKDKMRSHLHKYGSDMKLLARNIGEGLPDLVNHYIQSLSGLVKETTSKIDSSLLNEHRKWALELKKKAA